MTQKNEAEVAQYAENARSDLAWLAVVYVASKQFQIEITKQAGGLLFWSEQFVGQGLQGHFEAFKKAIRGLPQDNPGGYLNKSAVVYAAAIAEAFLRKAWQPAFGEAPPEKGGAGTLADVIESQKKIKGFRNDAQHVRFLAHLRNKIVHNYGRVDQDFLDNAKPIRDKCIWPDESDFDNKYPLEGPLWLAIDEVVVPYLHHALDFITLARSTLGQVAAKRT